jgi:hypothetical protein
MGEKLSFTGALRWVARLFCGANGQPSIRRVVFALTYLFGFGMCYMGFERDIAPNALTLAITLAGGATAAVGAGRFAEAMESNRENDKK